MTVEFMRGDLFTNEQCQAIAHGVNCMGVMGAGFALKIKELYPRASLAWTNRCQRQEIITGKCYVLDISDSPVVLQLTTQYGYGHIGRAQPAWVEAALKDMVTVMDALNVHSVAMPAIGCGLGGLHWSLVKSIINWTLADAPIHCWAYEPL